MVIVANQRQLDRRADVGLNQRTHAVVLKPIDPAVHVGGDVEDVALVAIVKCACASADAGGERKVDCAFYAVFVAVIEIEPAFDLASDHILGPPRNDIDHAGAGILPEQRALLAAQHFEPFDIGEVGKSLRSTAEHDPVENRRHRRFHRDRQGAGTEPAQKQRLVERGACLDEVQRGHK